jgi:hypothetical protein
MQENQESKEHSQSQQSAQARDETSINQQKDEPLPASSHADNDQAAVSGSEEHSAARPQRPAAHGDAVRDMMGGPPPQGDVPDAPATQIAAAQTDDEEPKVKHVANAVPGKPDGEVDTRS